MRKRIVAAVAATLMAFGLTMSVAQADDVTVTANGNTLNGSTQSSPFQADVAGTGISAVKFLLDGTYLGQDTTAPFSWPVTASTGAHTLKVRAVVNGSEQRSEHSFTVASTPIPTPSVTPSTPEPSPTQTAGGDVWADTVQEIRDAVANASPGTTVHISPGTYEIKPRLILSAEGTPSNPITLTGTNVLIRSTDTGGDYGLYVQGDYWKIENIKVGHASKGIVLDGSLGTVIDNIEVFDIGAEGVHFRANSRNGVLRNSSIHDTGRDKPQFGEGVYVGSASGNWSTTYVKVSTGETISYGQDGEGKDKSDGNLIENNVFENTNAEGADLKEGTNSGSVIKNTFINSGISGENSADSAIDAKGNNWQITGNTISLTAAEWTDDEGSHPVVYDDAMQTHVVYSGYGQSNYFAGNAFSGSVDGYLVKITNNTLNTPSLDNTVACGQSYDGATLGLSNITCS